MPKHDPLPGRKADYERAASAWERYKRMSKWMVVVAIVCAALSVWWLRRENQDIPWSFYVATFAGIALTILVATGLMGLVYLSHRGGHDEDTGHGE
jgi:uncharacterized membrane protein